MMTDGFLIVLISIASAFISEGTTTPRHDVLHAATLRTALQPADQHHLDDAERMTARMRGGRTPWAIRSMQRIDDDDSQRCGRPSHCEIEADMPRRAEEEAQPVTRHRPRATADERITVCLL